LSTDALFNVVTSLVHTSWRSGDYVVAENGVAVPGYNVAV